MGDFTPHQKKIINRYYEHRDQIMLGRLQEIVTDLFLAEGAAKQAQLWKRAESAMKSLKIAPNLIAHILAEKKPEVLAKNLAHWLEGRP